MNPQHWKYARVRPEAAAEYAVRHGDLLIVRGNANPDLVGCCGIVDQFPKDCIYPDLLKRIVLRDEPDGALSEYVVRIWNHPVVHNQIIKRAKTSNGTLKINSRDVKQIILPVPPRTEQKRLIGLMEAVDREIDSRRDSLAVLDRLKRGLMQDLLTGKVRVGRAAAGGSAGQLPVFAMET